MPEINLWAVVLSTVMTGIIGSIFYLPQFFGRRWIQLVGEAPQDVFIPASGHITGRAGDRPGRAREAAAAPQSVGSAPDSSMGGVGLAYSGVIFASVVTALVLAVAVSYVFAFNGGSYLATAVGVGLALWAGFTATRLFTHGLFDTRSLQVPFLNAFQELVTVLAMSTVIGLWPPAGL